MKFTHVENVEKLFEIIDGCKGTVELVTDEGDRLNLKSKLCQYISLYKIFSGGSEIKEMELIAHNDEDAAKLIRFMMTQD